MIGKMIKDLKANSKAISLPRARKYRFGCAAIFTPVVATVAGLIVLAINDDHSIGGAALMVGLIIVGPCISGLFAAALCIISLARREQPVNVTLTTLVFYVGVPNAVLLYLASEHWIQYLIPIDFFIAVAVFLAFDWKAFTLQRQLDLWCLGRNLKLLNFMQIGPTEYPQELIDPFNEVPPNIFELKVKRLNEARVRTICVKWPPDAEGKILFKETVDQDL